MLEAIGIYGMEKIETAVLAGLVTGDPVLLVGSHGSGKTLLCQRLATALGYRFWAYDAGKALFEDVLGFPNPASLSTGSVDYVPTPVSIWGKEFVLIDELSRANPSMQNKWLEIIRSRRIMGKDLPDLKFIIAAMNPPSYLGAHPLDAALAGRFAFVVQVPEVTEMPEDFARDLGEKTPLQRHVANIAEDIYINAELCRRFFPRGVPLLGKLYNQRRFPDCLLLPPAHYLAQAEDPDFNPENVDFSVPQHHPVVDDVLTDKWPELMTPFLERVEGAPPPERGRDFMGRPTRDTAAMLFLPWFHGWFVDRLMPLTEYFDELLPLFDDGTEVMLLGDHDHHDGKVPAWAEGFSERGGHSEDEMEEQIEVEVPWTKVGRIAVLIRRMIEPDPQNPREAQLLQPERSVLPWPGRRESLWLAAGVWPVFFNAPAMTRDLDYLRPHLYIDVSASTDEHQPKIFGLVTHLADLIGEPIYLFSNTVVEASLEDMAAGRVRTTGGTDFDCVVEHATRNNFKKVVMITDGCAAMNDKNTARVRSGEVKVLALLMGDCPMDNEPFEVVRM